nr:beta-1,6-N-acetylglucosaminyltransferase [Sphingomonas jejuensis]
MLARLADALLGRGFKLFIHVDRRSRFDPELLDDLVRRGCVVDRRYRIVWGGYTHLLAITDLMRRALRDPAVDYVHTLSGQDYPIKDRSYFDQVCDGRAFISWEPLAETPEEVRDRFDQYKLLYPVEWWRSIPGPIERPLRRLQRIFGIRRKGTRDFNRSAIFKGLVWLSLPADVARHAVESPAAHRLLRDLRFSYLPEEFFFQTMIANSPFSDRVAHDDLRYMDWGPRDGVRPAVLDARDEDALARSPALFARKFDSRRSAELLQALSAAESAAAA